MLDKQAIEEVNEETVQFVGHIFLRQKRDGGQCPVFNLKRLNRSIQYEHFKMEGIQTVKGLIRERDWMIKLNLKDAHFSVPITDEQRRFLQFR